VFHRATVRNYQLWGSRGHRSMSQELEVIFEGLVETVSTSWVESSIVGFIVSFVLNSRPKTGV